MAPGLYFLAMIVARHASSMLFNCTTKAPIVLGGAGTRFNFISVVNAKVPSEPANNLQKLKASFPSVNTSVSNNSSMA